MKVSLNTLMGSREALQLLLQTPLPASVAFTIKRVVEQANEVIIPAQEEILEARDRFKGEDDQIKKDKVDEFTKEVEELLVEEVNIDFAPINIDRLGDLMVTPETLIVLGWLIVE